jgi:inner membrane protein
MSYGMASFAIMAGPVQHILGVPEVPEWGIPIGLCVGAVAGLLPDIDEPNAMLARGSWVPRKLGPLARFVGTIVSLPFKIAGYFIKGVLGHRGGTHSLAMSIVFTLIFAIPVTALLGLHWDWLIWTVWFGFMSHLFADMHNPSGVPLMWPAKSKHKTFHVLPKAIRIPTQTPPNIREQTCRLGANAVTVICLVVFYALPLLWQLTGG